MFAYIRFDLKRKIKNPRTLFVIILIFILSLQKIGQYNIESRKSDNSGLYNRSEAIERRGRRGLNNYVLDYGDKADDNIINSYEVMENTGIQMKMAVKNEDYSEYNRLSTFGNLITAKSIISKEDRLWQMIFQKQAMEIWDNVSNGIPYDDVYFEKIGPRGNLPFYYKFLIEAKHDYILYTENLISLEPYYIDSISFIYMYLNEVLPFIMAFIILILTFDNVNEEWNSGSIKVTINNIFSRNKYIASKIITGILYNLFVIAMPPILISLIYGLFDSFGNYKYPVLYLKNGFKTLKPLPNYLEFDKINVGYNTSIGISLHSGIPKGEMGISNRLTLMYLYKFLILSIILLLFSIIFYVALNTLISSLSKNKIVGFIISAIITIVSTIISKPLTMNEHLNLSPFSMNNPIRILNGTYNVTALASLLILIGTSFLLILINIQYYKRKDL